MVHRDERRDVPIATKRTPATGFNSCAGKRAVSSIRAEVPLPIAKPDRADYALKNESSGDGHD